MVRRLIDLVYRDCWTALDLTYGDGGFWGDPLPPGLRITTNNLDPSSPAELHLDFTDTGLSDASYDLVVYDPPHLADGGEDGIMAGRYGSVKSTGELRALVKAGAREGLRLTRLGLLVKVTDSNHGGELLLLSDWIKAELGLHPYAVLHTYRPTFMQDGKWTTQRVPRSNGAMYLAFRTDGHRHRDFDALYARQLAAAPPS